MLAFAKTKILLLDDDKSFLKTMAYYLDRNFGGQAIIKQFNNYEIYLEYIAENCFLLENPQELISSFYKKEIGSFDAVKELSSLCPITVIDNNLNQEKNGIDVAKHIKDYFPNSYRILLTGCVDNQNAILLHNNDIINYFINKGSDDALQDLTKAISQSLENISRSFYYDADEVFNNSSIIESDEYISAKRKCLDQFKWSSYITINQDGNLVIMLENDKSIIACYDEVGRRFC